MEIWRAEDGREAEIFSRPPTWPLNKYLSPRGHVISVGRVLALCSLDGDYRERVPWTWGAFVIERQDAGLVMTTGTALSAPCPSISLIDLAPPPQPTLGRD